MIYFLKDWNTKTREHELIPCTVLKHDPNRALRRFGRRLGTWTHKFYKDMYCISFTKNGHYHVAWVKATRIISEV
jgi:hypothetical protein